MQKLLICFMCIFIVVGSGTIVRADLNDGLVAYYPFNGNANDESGNGHNGIEYGNIKYVSGKIGQAASFDGIDDFIEISSGELVAQDTITVSAWIKIPGNFSVEHEFNHIHNFTIYVQNDNFSGFVTHQMTISEDGKLAYDNWHPNGIVSPSCSSIAFSKWQHVAIVRDADTLYYYINGILNSITPNAEERESSATIDRTLIGSRYSIYTDSNGIQQPAAPHTQFYGEMDDIRIYNRALSESEIQELYNEGSSNTGCFSQADIDAAYNSGYSAGLSANGGNGGSGTPASVDSNLNIYIPSATFNSSNIWIKLKYNGTSGFDHIWKLDDYGSN